MLKVPKYKDITLLISVFNTILTLGTLKPTFTPPEPTLAKFVTISSKFMMTSSKFMMTFSRIMMTSSKNVTTSTFLREYIR